MTFDANWNGFESHSMRTGMRSELTSVPKCHVLGREWLSMKFV